MQRLAADTHATSSTVSTLVRNAESTSTLIAGAGLTGGGPLNSSTPVTLNVGAGTGILVAADSISFDTSVLSGYVTGSGTNQRLLKWNGTGSVAADSHIAEGTTGAFVASFNTNDLTADRTYQFVDPYAAFPYVVTGTDTSSYVSPDCAVALWAGQGQVDSHDGLIFGKTSKNLLIGDGSIGGSPGITIRARDSVGSIQDATIQLRVGDPPTVTYRSAVTGGNHNFIGNQPSFTAVVSVTGGVTGSWFNRVNITDPGSPNTATLTLTANKTLAATNTLTLSGTDSTTHTFPSTSSNVARIDAAQTFVGVQTFGGTLVNRSTTATQFITGYDTTHGMEFNTDSIGGTVLTLKGDAITGTPPSPLQGLLRITPAVGSMALSSKAWTFRVDDLSGNQRFWVGRTTGNNALNHGVRIGFDDSNYLQFQGGIAAAGVMAMTLVGITSLTLPNPSSCTNMTLTTPTFAVGTISSSAAAGSNAFSFNTTATRNTGVTVVDFADNGTSLLTIAKTAGGYLFSGGVDFKLTTAGNGIYIKEGTDATSGVVTLVAGVKVVATTKVTANSRIYLTRQTVAGTVGTSVDVTARTAGTSFTITAAGSVLDTSTVAWLIIEPG